MITIGTTVKAAASGTLPEVPWWEQHRLADEVARVAEHRGDDEVAEGQREGEDGPGDDAGESERQGDMAKGRRRRGAEVSRGLEQRARHPLERRLDRQHHVGQPEVEKGEKDPGRRDRQRRSADQRQREPAVEEDRESRVVDDPRENSLLGEDQLPGVDADEIARPERQDDREVEQRPPPAGSVEGHVEGERKGEDHRRDGHRRRHGDGAQDDVEIRPAGESGVGFEGEAAHNLAGVMVEAEERLHQERAERADVGDPQPEKRRDEEQGERDSRPPVEKRRQASEQRRGSPRSLRSLAAAQPAASGRSWMGSQARTTRSPRATAPAVADATFCATTWSVPPPSIATV